MAFRGTTATAAISEQERGKVLHCLDAEYDTNRRTEINEYETPRWPAHEPARTSLSHRTNSTPSSSFPSLALWYSHSTSTTYRQCPSPARSLGVRFRGTPLPPATKWVASSTDSTLYGAGFCGLCGVRSDWFHFSRSNRTAIPGRCLSR